MIFPFFFFFAKRQIVLDKGKKREVKARTKETKGTPIQQMTSTTEKRKK
jgi:hypothetical protein